MPKEKATAINLTVNIPGYFISLTSIYPASGNIRFFYSYKNDKLLMPGEMKKYIKRRIVL